MSCSWLSQSRPFQGTHHRAGSWWGPVTVPVNGPSGEVPAVETGTNGPSPIRLPRSFSCGNAPINKNNKIISKKKIQAPETKYQFIYLFRGGHGFPRMIASLFLLPLLSSLFPSILPQSLLCDFFGGPSAVCAWLYVSLLSLMRVDITGAEGDRGGFGCSDVQQWLELDCCIPKNRGTTACCYTKLDMAIKCQIQCIFIHSFKIIITIIILLIIIMVG